MDEIVMVCSNCGHEWEVFADLLDTECPECCSNNVETIDREDSYG